MEEAGLRTPHILEQINELIDYKSLVAFKEASRILCTVIENQKSGKYQTTRMIQAYVKNSAEFGKDWRIVFQKLSAEKLSEFGILVKDFYKALSSRFEENWSPMHIAAERGHLDFCKFMAKVSVTKSFKWSPLLFSAQAGHLEVSKYLYSEIDNKTPRIGPFQISAQHLAAKNGHLDIFRFLHENMHVLNPAMEEGITPLHLAAQNGHFDVCKYICDTTQSNGAPQRSDFLTPRTLAQHKFHSKVVTLLFEREVNHFRANIDVIDVLSVILPKNLLYVSICMFLFLAMDIFQYPYSGVSKTFNEAIERIGKAFLMIPFFLAPMTLILKNIVKDIWFSFWTSPKLDY